MKIASHTTVEPKPGIHLAYRNSLILSDEELIIQIANRDEEAFKCLFTKYWNELYQITYSRVLSKTATKGILIDVFKIVWKNAESMPDTYSVKDCLHSIVKCQIFKYYERHPLTVKKIAFMANTAR